MQYLLKIISLICLLALAACSQNPASVVNKSAYQYGRYTESKNPFIVKVKTGDTLYSLSKIHGVGIREFIELNKLRPPYLLIAGQTLKLPQAKFHIVKKGDTVYAVSRSYGVDLGRLVHINNMTVPYTIWPGTKLTIPSSMLSDAELAAKDQPETNIKVENIRQAVQEDLKLLDEPVEKTAFVLPKKVNVEHIDPNAPKPTLRGSIYPAPTLKPGTKYAKAPTPVMKRYQKTSYNYQPIGHLSSGFDWPTRGKLISGFGPKKGGLYNDGVNIAAKRGAPIKASDNGQVVYSGNELRGYGNLLLVKHSNGYITAYAHSDKMLVSKGDYVNKGQTIAHVGSTGHVKQPQLHFSIRKGRKALDPKRFLPKG